MTERTAENPYGAALRRLKRTAILVAAFSALVNLLMLTGPLFMLQVYDRVLSSGSVATLQGLFVIVVIAYAFLGFFDFIRTRILSRAAYRLDEATGDVAFDTWVRSGIDPNARLSRPLNDLSTVRGFLSSPAMLGMFDLPWTPFFLAVVFLIHPWLGWLAIFGAFVVIALALANQALTRKHLARAMTMDGSESFFVEQSRRNAEAILPLGMMGKVADRWRRMHDVGLATGQTGGDRGEGFAAASKAFRLLLQSALLGLGGYLALNLEISAGMIVAVSVIAGRALAPIDQVIGQWRNVVRAREAHKRLKAALDDLPAEKPRIELPAPTGALTVSGLVKYAPDEGQMGERAPILDHVSFRLEPGDGLGVIGPSASGKSTLARILVGAWRPDHGEVRLDGATLDQWRPDDLGRFVGYLPQSLELLAGSIGENISRFDPEASDEGVIEAARMAGVNEMILRLPDGYATEIGYGLQRLSGGQVQRVGLARAIYGEPKLVVLDEPNSNLDAGGDEALAGAIASLRQAGSVAIVMAHRPSAIAAVNKLLVLRDGRVAEFGPKDEVMAKVTRPTSQAERRTG